VNECTASNSTCEQICINTIGSFVCNCSEGFSLNSSDMASCDGEHTFHHTVHLNSLFHPFPSDIDECDTPGVCGDNATCNNTIGSFLCECNLGYSGDGFVCSSKSLIVSDLQTLKCLSLFFRRQRMFGSSQCLCC